LYISLPIKALTCPPIAERKRRFLRITITFLDTISGPLVKVMLRTLLKVYKSPNVARKSLENG